MLTFTKVELDYEVTAGNVSARRHSTLPFTIYNYTPRVVVENNWNEVTLTCRGLILDDNFNIVARPWKKFFNLGQVDLPIQFDTHVEITDKADGSLLVMYPEDEGYAFATRGSFESDQAKLANELWAKHKDEWMPYGTPILPGFTYLFELVGPSNRIVLEYPQDTFILLGCVENETGYVYGPNIAAAYLDWMGNRTAIFEYDTISDALAHMNRENAEGYVIRFNNFMVKLKQPDYLELHRLVTNCSPKTVWEQLRAGKSKDEILSVFPDEFHDYIRSMIDPLSEAFFKINHEVEDAFSEIIYTLPADFSRRQFAERAKQSVYTGLLFARLDNRPLNDMIWKMIKPRGNNA